jgi:hypothetical protein
MATEDTHTAIESLCGPYQSYVTLTSCYYQSVERESVDDQLRVVAEAGDRPVSRATETSLEATTKQRPVKAEILCMLQYSRLYSV